MGTLFVLPQTNQALIPSKGEPSHFQTALDSLRALPLLKSAFGQLRREVHLAQALFTPGGFGPIEVRDLLVQRLTAHAEEAQSGRVTSTSSNILEAAKHGIVEGLKAAWDTAVIEALAAPGDPRVKGVVFLEALVVHGTMPAIEAFRSKFKELQERDAARPDTVEVGAIPPSSPPSHAPAVPVTQALYDERPAAASTPVRSREHEEVEGILGMDEAALEARRDKEGLSLGEGFSNYARNLEDAHGAHIKAVDQIYALTPEEWAKIPDLRKNGAPVTPEWVEGRLPKEHHAWDVTHLPVADASQDFVDASFLISHLDECRATEEVMRVLRPGGEFRFNLWYKDAQFPAFNRSTREFEAWVKETWPGATIEVQKNLPSGKPRDPSEDGQGWLVVIKKPEA